MGMDIGVDVDDVLMPWSINAHKVCEAAGITNGKQITQWEFWRDYGCTPEVLWEVIHDAYEEGMLLSDPFPGAADALRSLRAAGHRIHIVTARGFEGPLAGMVREDTAYWLDHFRFEHDSLTFAKDKTVLRLDVLVDDGPKNITAVEAVGVTTYLVDAIHNQDFEHPARVRSITEFAEAILGLEEAA